MSTKFCSSHEIFTTKINNFANLECFAKFLCHENLELYGTLLFMTSWELLFVILQEFVPIDIGELVFM